MAVDLTISIVNYGTWGLTHQCLLSIGRYRRGLSLEVVVVDNTPPPMSGTVPDLIEPIDYPLHIVRNHANRGFGFAHNQAFAFANGEFFLVLNNDVRFLDNTRIDEILNWMRDHSSVGIVGIAQESDQLENTHVVAFDRFPGLKEIFNIYWLNRYQTMIGAKDQTRARKVAHINGAFMCFRRDLFHTLNGFLSEYFLYFEDTDICFRSHKRCWQTWFLPRYSIWHEAGASARNEKVDNRFFCSNYDHYHRSLLTFMALYYPRWQVFLTWVGLWVNFWCKFIWHKGFRNSTERGMFYYRLFLTLKIWRGWRAVRPRRVI